MRSPDMQGRGERWFSFYENRVIMSAEKTYRKQANGPERGFFTANQWGEGIL